MSCSPHPINVSYSFYLISHNDTFNLAVSFITPDQRGPKNIAKQLLRETEDGLIRRLEQKSCLEDDNDEVMPGRRRKHGVRHFRIRLDEGVIMIEFCPLLITTHPLVYSFSVAICCQKDAYTFWLLHSS